jgi:hypothetical protein
MKRLVLILLLFVCQLQAGTIYIISGTYTGNVSGDNREISLGFQPDAVIVGGPAGAGYWYWKTNTMTAGDNCLRVEGTGNYQVNYIQSLGVDGFQVGTSLNTNTKVYRYLAMKNYTGYIATGYYDGDGNDNNTSLIASIGFQPGFIMIQNDDNGVRACWKCTGLAGDNTVLFYDGFISYANLVQSLDVNGVTLGTNTYVNTSGKTYHWLAIKDITNYVMSSTFTGNDADNRDITTPGFSGNWMFIQNIGGGTSGNLTTALGSSGVSINSWDIDMSTELDGWVTGGFRVSGGGGWLLNKASQSILYWYINVPGTINVSTRKNVVVVQ